jgi:uncharacterized protein YbjT (DUF2867 family)
VAKVAALVLTEDGHEGATYDLPGPERLSVRQMAARAAEVLGRPVEAVRLGLDAWLAGPGAALEAHAREDLLAMFRAYDREGLVGDAATLRSLLGRSPKCWHEVLRA